MGLSDLFGGSDKIDILTGGQRNLLDQLSGIVGKNLEQPGQVYPGQTFLGADPLMTQAFQQAGGVTAMNPNIDMAVNAGLMGMGDIEGVRGAFESALAPARLEFDRTLDRVGARYGDTWGRTGAMPEMMGRATAEYGMGLNSLLGQLTYNDRQASADRQVSAIQPALATENQQMTNLRDLFNVGQARRGLGQEQMQNDYARWLSGQWYNNPALQFIGPVLGTQAHAIGQQTGILPGIAGILGGGGQAAAGLAAMV